MRRFLSLVAGLPALAVVLGLAIAPAQAQSEVSDEKLQSFVTAALAVQGVIEQWQPRLGAAENEQQALELREQANAELVAAIEDTPGMSVEEYQEIGEAAQADPTLADRIRVLYEDQQGQ